MADDGLAGIRTLFPDEYAAAKRLAATQAAAMIAIEQDLGSLHLPAAVMAPPRPVAAACAKQHGQGASTEVPLHQQSLRKIGQQFASGRLHPVMLLQALLARIDRIDGQLNSFVVLDRSGATAAAAAAAARFAANKPLGPLDGIPVGIKDVIDVAGMPTRCHSRATRDAPSAADAEIVARLRAGGAIILGKLATHEFAIGGPAFDLPFPPARNPWNHSHHPGGSSSGAGAAVAAGLVPLAIGTDTAGSVRHPASACGILGLKPGAGVLPLTGVVPLSPTLDHIGVLTRTADDMTIAAQALGIATTGRHFNRVGYVRHFHLQNMTATSDVAASLERAAQLFDAVEVVLPPLGAFALVNRIILQTEGYAIHGHHLRTRAAEMSSLTRSALLPGALTRPATIAAAWRVRDMLRAAVKTVFANVDLLLTASSMETPCRIDDAVDIARSYMLQARTPFNVTGHPALAMGAGLGANGLPLSLQFVTEFGFEGRLLAAAEMWEAAIGGPLIPPIG